MTQAFDILTRDRVCMACDCSDFVGDGEYLTCEHVIDDHGHPLTCRLKAMLANPAAKCPHPDAEQSRRWNEASVIQVKGCGGVAPSRSPAAHRPSTLTLRVRACIGNGVAELPCEHAGDGWTCALIGRSIATDLKSPSFACPAGRFGAEVAHG